MATFTAFNTRLNPNLQTLIWLLGALSITYALHAINLHSWVSVSFVLFAIWRFLMEKNGWRYPPLWVRLPLTIIGGVAVLASYGSLFGRDASMALFAVMVALKLLETKTPRDFIVMVILGYFLTINVLLFTQAIWVFFIIQIPILALTACLVSTSYSSRKNALSHITMKTQAGLAGRMLLQAVPIMLVLFILFPRIPGPIWGIPRDAYSGMTGLSDSMEPGSISDLSLSSKVAFRAEFKSVIPANNQLYWRGPVLWHQVGRSWLKTSERLILPQESLNIKGKDVNYTITLEPHNRNWLLMLDIPISLPPNATVKHDFQVLSNEPIRTRIRYDGQSNLQYVLGETLNEQEQTLSLQLSEDENPKTHALAKQWLAENKSPSDIVLAAIKMFREQPFIYTLAPPRLGNEPVDDFLFNTRRGFCEHYSSSFVYLMRAAGVPARIVTGYQGGELNPNGNYLIVRQSDAHAWAEVWLKGRGWVRVDPTSAVSPSRIESGIGTALSDSNLLPLFARQDYPMLKKLYLNWDAVNNGWNQWVLGYDQQKQLSLLSKIIGKKIAWEDMGLILVGVMISLMLIISYFLLRNQAVLLSPVKKSYHRFLNKLGKIGLVKLPHEGVINFGNRAAAQLPEKTKEIDEISQLYSSIQYANSNQNSSIALLKKLVKGFSVK